MRERIWGLGLYEGKCEKNVRKMKERWKKLGLHEVEGSGYGCMEGVGVLDYSTGICSASDREL